ncbi:MAG: hypothetical protein MUF78_07640 [Candidatus Edwardsbacteria bacterium]|jgi:hypothetical protein|nr:hypothetical protein [Candidatus Edwardsbacteria bacterium]
MRRSLIVLIAAALAGAAAGQDLHPLGGLVHDPRPPELRQTIPVPPLTATTLPSKVDLSAGLPPVGMQTGNSCTGWSVGYYFKTQQEFAEHGWDPADPGHQFSPSFIYNLLDSGVDWGVDLFDALELMWSHGCATVSQMPYDGGYTVWPSAMAFDSALLYRCERSGYPWFSFGNDGGIAYAKQLLSENKCVVFNIGVFYNFDHITDYDTVYCAADSSGNNRGGHNLCIVGYDDTKATRDGTGAFRCVNSWGTGWGNKGYWWLSYQMVRSHPRMVYPWAGYVPDRAAYQPTLKARVRIGHARRGRIELVAGIGDPASPLWSQTFFVVGNGQGEYWSTGGDLPFPATDLVLDLSDGADQLDSSAANTVFVGCIDTYGDGISGSIGQCSAEYLPWGASAVSADPPVAIPDYNTYAYCEMTLTKPAGVAGPAGAGSRPAPRPIALRVSPNPARERCRITLDAPGRGAVALSVYDTAGRLVRRFPGRAADQPLVWDTRDDRGARVPSGVYFARARLGDATAAGRLLVVR